MGFESIALKDISEAFIKNYLSKCFTFYAGFLFSIFSPIEAFARNPFALYQFAGADKGRCMAPLGANASDVLSRNGISYSGSPSYDEVKSLAKGVEQIERLRGGSSLPKSWRTRYNYVRTSSKSTWNQGEYAINVRRPGGSTKGSNVTRLMHELGHKVGNAGVYQEYKNYIGRNRCDITQYSKRKSNEEFAESFAAFVTWPDKLEEKCPKSFRFFKNRLFPKSENALATCNGAGEIVRSSLANKSQDTNAILEPSKIQKTKVTKRKTARTQRNSYEYYDYYDHYDHHDYANYYDGFR